MTALPIYRGIEGVEGREPVGAVLTVGKKGSSGAPVENDRFFFVSPYEVNGIRAPLPEFRRFNDAKVELRQTIQGNLVHASVGESWLHHLRAQKLPKPHPNPPGRKPACTGDGHLATRFAGMDGDEERWNEIVCPNNTCEFRQGDKKACGPMGRLYFRPRWTSDPPLPTPLVKWVTHSWNSVANVVGFFDHVAAQARNLGLESWSIYGLPFVLTLGRKTQPQRERAFPVVSISPLLDLVTFFGLQRKQLADAGGRLALPVGNTTPEESTPDALSLDSLAIVPGVPGDSALPIDAVDAELVDAADQIERECEAKVDAIEAELSRRHPGDDSKAEKARQVLRQRYFSVSSRMFLGNLSLDALADGLERLRAS